MLFMVNEIYIYYIYIKNIHSIHIQIVPNDWTPKHWCYMCFKHTMRPNSWCGSLLMLHWSGTYIPWLYTITKYAVQITKPSISRTPVCELVVQEDSEGSRSVMISGGRVYFTFLCLSLVELKSSWRNWDWIWYSRFLSRALSASCSVREI